MAVKKKVVEIDTQQATTSVKDLRNQLKQLKDTMLSTEQGTEEYNNAMIKAADIMHTLKEQQEELNASAMDFGQITGNVVKATGGLVAGLQAAKATMNLFGVENDAVLESLQKMQNLMAITQALPALDNGVKAFKRLSLVIKSATGATHGFKAALVSTGIGAAVVAVGLLVANFDKLKAAITGTNEELEKQKKLKIEEDLKKTNDALEKRLNLEQQIRKAAGQSDLEIAKERVKTIEKEIRDNEALSKEYERQAAMKAGEKVNAINAGKAQSVVNALLNEERKLYEKSDVYARRANEIRENALKTAQEEVKLQERLEAASNIKKRNDEEAAAAEERRKKALEDILKLQDSYNKLKDEIRTYSMTDEEKELDKLNKLEEEKTQIVTDWAARRKITTEESEQQISEIHTYYENQRLEITKKYADERAAAAAEEAEKKKEAERQKVEEALTNLQFLYDQQILVISEKELELSEQYRRGGITSEEYQEQLKLAQEQELQTLIESLEKQLEVENLTADEEIAIKQRVVDAKMALNEMQVQNAEESAQREVMKWNAAAQGIGSIFSSLGDLMEEGSEEQKALQIMGATINMLAGITMAISGLFTTKTGPWDIALAAIQAGAIATSGAATIAKMAKTKKQNTKSAGSSASAASSAVTMLQAPVQYTQDVQGSSIEGAIKDTKVYVTETDITDTQNRVNVSESEARY